MFIIRVHRVCFHREQLRFALQGNRPWALSYGNSERHDRISLARKGHLSRPASGVIHVSEVYQRYGTPERHWPLDPDLTTFHRASIMIYITLFLLRFDYQPIVNVFFLSF